MLIQGGKPFSRFQGKRRKMVQKKLMGEHLKCINLGFPWQSSVKTELPGQGAWVRAIVGEPRSCMPSSGAKKKKQPTPTYQH